MSDMHSDPAPSVTVTFPPGCYPALIGVFCDRPGCAAVHEADYLVHERDDQATRFGYARAELRREGWRCDESGDFCPAHAGPPS